MGDYKDDRELIEACLRGDGEALHELCVRFRHAIYVGAVKAKMRRSGIPGTADDLADEFLVSVFESPNRTLRTSVGRLSLSTWLTAVAFRQCSKMLRSREWRSWPLRGRVRRIDLAKLVAPVALQRHSADLVRLALSQLDIESQAIIEARFGLRPDEKPLSVQQIANRLACGRATAYRRLRIALGRFGRIVRALEGNLEE